MEDFERWMTNAKCDLKVHHRGNYIRIKDKHIFLGFTPDDLKRIQDDINLKPRAAFHIFIVSETDADVHLLQAVEHILQNGNRQSIVRIHIPKILPNLNKLTRFLFKDVDSKKLDIIFEKKGPTFCINESNGYYMTIDYDTIYLRARVTVGGAYIMPNGEGAIRNSVQRSNPELFKGSIIENFKAVTPLSILKSFKNENDIWDYIMGMNEWENNKDIVVKSPLAVPVGEDPKVYVKDTMNKVANKLRDMGFNVNNTIGKESDK